MISSPTSKSGKWKNLSLVISSLSSERQPLFLKQLSSIRLSELKNLICTECGINSIEIINQCNFPKIESINIGQNNLISLKSMRKGQWKELKYIGLCINFSLCSCQSNI